jgi:hypothetical protein
MDNAVWYGFFALIIGQRVFQFAIKKFKRTSWIAFDCMILFSHTKFTLISKTERMGFKLEFLFINKKKEIMLIFTHIMSINHSPNFLKVLFWYQKLQTNEFLLFVLISHLTILSLNYQ